MVGVSVLVFDGVSELVGMSVSDAVRVGIEVLVGVRETKEKLLVKSTEEYTSPIQKIYKTGADFIIMTENSIYLVCASIPTKRIS